jgi:predicted DNA-binding transcriptional regulator YafY
VEQSRFYPTFGAKTASNRHAKDGSTHAEIADELGVSKKTVDSWFDISGSLFCPCKATTNMWGSSVEFGKDLIREYAPQTTDPCVELSREPHAPGIRVQAAKASSQPRTCCGSARTRGRAHQSRQRSPELQEAISEEWRVIEAGRAALAIGFGQLQEGEVVT